jgi:hypothetical protein
MNDPRTADDKLSEVELTAEQTERAGQLEADIFFASDALDAAREIIYLRDQVTDLRASLRREENARKNAVAEADRLRADRNRLQDKLDTLGIR